MEERRHELNLAPPLRAAPAATRGRLSGSRPVRGPHQPAAAERVPDALLRGASDPLAELEVPPVETVHGAGLVPLAGPFVVTRRRRLSRPGPARRLPQSGAALGFGVPGERALRLDEVGVARRRRRLPVRDEEELRDAGTLPRGASIEVGVEVGVIAGGVVAGGGARGRVRPPLRRRRLRLRRRRRSRREPVQGIGQLVHLGPCPSALAVDAAAPVVAASAAAPIVTDDRHGRALTLERSARYPSPRGSVTTPRAITAGAGALRPQRAPPTPVLAASHGRATRIETREQVERPVGRVGLIWLCPERGVRLHHERHHG